MFIICLKRQGRKKLTQFAVVVVIKKSSHNFILEKIGFLDYHTFKLTNVKTNLFLVNKQRLKFWILKGAQLTPKLNLLLKKFGIFF